MQSLQEKYKLQGNMKPISIRNSRRVSVIPTLDPHKRALAMVKLAGQMWALTIICEKEFEELDKLVPEDAKQYLRETATWIGKPRRRYRREISDEDFRILESTLNEAAEVAKPYVKRAKLYIRETMVQKVPWQHLDVMEELGFCGGLVICMNQIHVNMYGKNSPDYQQADFYMGIVNRKVSCTTMNGKDPDLQPAYGAIIDMFKAVGNAVDKRLFTPIKRQTN